MPFKDDTIDRLKKLESKYATIGQDLDSYLDGLLFSNVTTYWDYLNLDALLSLQHPKTDFPDQWRAFGTPRECLRAPLWPPPPRL